MKLTNVYHDYAAVTYSCPDIMSCWVISAVTGPDVSLEL